MVKIENNGFIVIITITFLLTGQENERDVSASSEEFIGISEATYGAEEQGWPC